MPVYIHLDESCLGNQFRNRGRPGGAGALAEVWRKGEWCRRDLWLSEPDTTNNRMALAGALAALEEFTEPRLVHMVSDSTYLVKGINEWLPVWKQRGYRRRSGPIQNLDMWQRLDALLTRHEVRAEWVRGHAGHPENSYADFLATRAAARQDNTDGWVESGFPAWLDERRERGQFLDYAEFAAPAERFRG